MIHEIHCRRCNEQLLEPTLIHEGEMDDVPFIPPGLFFDESSGMYYKRCPHCGARNGFREQETPGRGKRLLLNGLLD